MGSRLASKRVQVFLLDQRHRSLRGRIKKLAEKVLNFLTKEWVILEVYLVSSAMMRTLNKRFRSQEKATNVLSFEAGDPADFFEVKIGVNRKFRKLGEIYLCPSYIAQNHESLDRMLIHGILHLFHYRHDRKGDTIRMENLEKKISRVLRVVSN